MGISPKIDKRGGSNNRVGARIPQKLINVEVLIKHASSWEIFLKNGEKPEHVAAGSQAHEADTMLRSML